MMIRVTANLATQAARPVLRIAMAVLTVIVLAAAFFAVWYRQTYNVWPGQEASARVHWCGRDYQSGGGEWSWSQVAANASGRPVRLVAEYPPLGMARQQLYAAVTPQAQRDSFNPPLPCAMGVYLRTGSDSYRPYALEGGP